METSAFEPLYANSTGTASGNLIASTTLSASTSAASGELPGGTGSNFRQIQIANTTTAWAYVNFGTASLTAATVAAGYPVAPGSVVVVTVNTEVCYASAILGSSSGAVIFSRGIGL